MNRINLALALMFLTGQLYAFSLGTTQLLTDVEYTAGVSEWKAGHLDSALALLKSGWLRSGDDLRFLPVLAGVEYKSGNLEQAKNHLMQLLRIQPDHRYANELLGTIFLLEENLEASLKYWNRVGKPRILEVEMQPAPPVNPILMDRAIAIAPSSPLELEEYFDTEARLQVMGIFRDHEFLLRPRKASGEFDLILRPQVRRGTFSSKWKIGALVAQGLFSDSIRVDFPNISGTTISSSSWISWDEYKHRLSSWVSFPFGDNPHSRIRIFADAKKETWSLSGADLYLSRWETGVEFTESTRKGLTWRSGAIVSWRNYQEHVEDPLFRDGAQSQLFGNVNVSVLRIPEHRFVLDSSTTIEAGTFLGKLHGSAHFQQAFHARWFPDATGEKLFLNGRLIAGKAFGRIPFDEYFALGAERDSDLLLRAHRSSIEKKGENPIAPAYVVFNGEITRNLTENRKIRWRLTPYLDIAWIEDSQTWTGERWFMDVGMQSGLRVYGSTELVLTYGKDLRTGRNVLYLGASL